MKPKLRIFILTASFFTWTWGVLIYGTVRGGFSPIILWFFVVGLFGFAVTSPLMLTTMFDFTKMREIEAQFTGRKVLTLKRSYPVSFIIGPLMLLVAMVALVWNRLSSSGLIANRAQVAWTLVGIPGIVVVSIAWAVLLLWRHRSELQRYESERAAITSSGVAFIHRTAVKEATAENTKLVRIYAVQPTMVSVDTIQGHFGFDSRVEGFDELTKAVLTLTDKVKIYGRKDRLPAQMQELLRGKKVLW